MFKDTDTPNRALYSECTPPPGQSLSWWQSAFTADSAVAYAIPRNSGSEVSPCMWLFCYTLKADMHGSLTLRPLQPQTLLRPQSATRSGGLLQPQIPLHPETSFGRMEQQTCCIQRCLVCRLHDTAGLTGFSAPAQGTLPRGTIACSTSRM